MSSGASLRCAPAMARAVSSPYCAAQRCHSQSGVLRRGASSLASTASPSSRDAPQHGIDQRLEMHRLVVGGGEPVGGIDRGMGRDLRIRSSQAPSSNISIAGPALCGGSGLATKWRGSCVQLAEMAQVSLASARAKPASRGGKALQSCRAEHPAAGAAQHAGEMASARACARGKAGVGHRLPCFNATGRSSAPGSACGSGTAFRPPWPAAARCVPRSKDGWRTGRTCRHAAD